MSNHNNNNNQNGSSGIDIEEINSAHHSHSQSQSRRSGSTANIYGLKTWDEKIVAFLASIFLIPFLSAKDDFVKVLAKMIVMAFSIVAMTMIIVPAIYYSYMASNPTYKYPVEYYGSENEQRNAIIYFAAIYWFLMGPIGIPCAGYVLYTRELSPFVTQYFLCALTFSLVIIDLSVTFFSTTVIIVFFAQAAFMVKAPYPSLVYVPCTLYYILFSVRECLRDETSPADFMRIPGAYTGTHPAERIALLSSPIVVVLINVGMVNLIMREYLWQKDGAQKSADLARGVSQNLVSYSTDKCRDILDDAAKNAILARHEFGSVVTMLQEMRIEKDMEEEEEEGIKMMKESQTDGIHHQQNRAKNTAKAFQRFGVSEELCLHFRKMCDNLDRYRPHIPDYLILEIDEDEAEELGEGIIGNTSNAGRSKQSRTSKDGEEKVEQNDDEDENEDDEFDNSEFNQSQTSVKSDVSGLAAAPKKTGSRVKINLPGFSIDSDDGSGSSSQKYTPKNRQSPGGIIKKANANGALNQPHAPLLSGVLVDRVVVGRLNFSRISELVFDRDLRSFTNIASGKINDLVSAILEHAVTQDAAVHALVGDVIFVSWNSTTKIVHGDLKACNFFTALPELLKNALLIGKPKQQQQGHIVAPNAAIAINKKNKKTFISAIANVVTDNIVDDEPWRRRVQEILSENENNKRQLLYGAAVSGSAWCQVGGSSRRQQFMLSAFSHERVLDEASRCAARGGFYVVCRHIQSNAAHEYYLRGCSVVPYAHLVDAAASKTYTPNLDVSSLGSALYEIVSRKAISNGNDEWLYQLQGGGAESGTKKNVVKDGEPIGLALSDVVQLISRGKLAAGTSMLSQLKNDQPLITELESFKIIEGVVIPTLNKIVSLLSQPNSAISSTNGHRQQQIQQPTNLIQVVATNNPPHQVTE